MSRNRCTIDCACGLWSFQTESFFQLRDPSLLTEEAYFAAIGWPDCPYRSSADPANACRGHGYRADLVGDHFAWERRGPNGDLTDWTNRESAPEEGWSRVLSARYLDVPPEDRFRFRRLDCVFCQRPYVGWYRQDPVDVLAVGVYDWADLPGFRLYDTSYWWAFNDEPSSRDKAPVREWTPEKLAALAKRWNEEER